MKKTLFILFLLCLLCIGCKSKYDNEKLNEDKSVENLISNVNNKTIDDYELLNNDSEDVNNVKKILSSENNSDLMSYNLSEVINMIKQSDYYTFYLTKIGEVRYYVCGYSDSMLHEGVVIHDKQYYDQLKWVKFTFKSEIQKSIDELELDCVYCVHDYFVIKDVVYGIEVNKSYKFYDNITKIYINNSGEEAEINGSYLFLGKKGTIDENENNMALFDINLLIKIGKAYYLSTDYNGIFIILNKEYNKSDSTVSQNLLKNELNEYYDDLYPYVIDDESLKIKKESNYITYEISRVKLDINEIIKIIKEENE